jgi:RNA polymerase sigma-70 factor (ECF subfamily)
MYPAKPMDRSEDNAGCPDPADQAFTAALCDAMPDLRLRLRRRLSDPADAEEAAQEAFLRAWRSRGQTEIRDARGYLFGIGDHVAVDRIRDRTRSARLQPDQADTLPALVADHAPGPEQILGARQYLQQVAAVLSALPAATRQAQLLHVSGHSQVEIAERLQISPRMVRKHLAKVTAEVAQLRAGWNNSDGGKIVSLLRWKRR